ncbi:MAG: SRPBCC domain-containing protein [Sumerlaeia bacterium]
MIEPTIELEISRIISASRERVFNAWKKIDAMQHWWAASENNAFAGGSIDFRVGGKYHLSMRVFNKDIVRTSYGEYVEIDEPSRLVFTWNWQHDETPMNSLVTLQFNSLELNKTELILRHEKLPDTEMGRKHQEGWNAVLLKLQDYLLKQ